MSVEHCNTEHYAVLFKILDIMPDILRDCPIPYSVYGGYAIVKQLEHHNYYVPNTDIWDSYDFDIHTTNPNEMVEYIIDEIVDRTLLRSDEILQQPTILEGDRGIQLSLMF